MVCIPCIVVPVLLWVYKKFLEPYIYPYIAPLINRIWPKKAVAEAGPQSKTTQGACKGESQPLTNGTSNGIITTGPEETSDKKTD
ncbi:hypothetical protein NDU88_006184 [Pleurodeles waltl]|uniref:CR032 protein n=1 Tax=Pleurodeles waltl TaxID=8319 RepID=A0AAV7WDJ7_PLEWA|nr:hypothetical protein NDU88_006184 [Pleurodeles waltl]